jgi:DNA polymerase III subunit delta
VATIAIEQLKQSIKNKKIAPVYFIHGTEPFLIERLTKATIQAALEPGSEDFNLNVLYGNEVDGAQIVNAAMAYPMMASRRVVLVKNIHLMNESNLAFVAKYVEKPSLSTCFLMTCEKAISKKSLIQRIVDSSTVIEVKSLYDSDIPQWIIATLSEQGFTIADDALRMLHAYCGTSLSDIQSEIDKIVLNLGERKKIELQDVESVIGAHRQFNIFELCNAVGTRNMKKSIYILNQMLQLGELPTGILAMVVRHFTILAKIKDLKDRKMTNNEICKSVKLSSFFINGYIQQAASYSLNQLGIIFTHLLEADESLKSSYQKPKLVLEILFFKIMSL